MCQFLQESTVTPVTPDCSLLVRSLSGRFQGKIISADQVKSMDFRVPIPVVMHGRLRGGSAIPGAWVCNVCSASGCWPTKSRCFRCGHARDSRITAGASGSSPPAGREKAHPGRAPRAKAAPVNPTFPPPRVIPPKKPSSSAAATSPPVSPQAQVPPEVLVAALRALGIGEDIYSRKFKLPSSLLLQRSKERSRSFFTAWAY